MCWAIVVEIASDRTRVHPEGAVTVGEVPPRTVMAATRTSPGAVRAGLVIESVAPEPLPAAVEPWPRINPDALVGAGVVVGAGVAVALGGGVAVGAVTGCAVPVGA